MSLEFEAYSHEGASGVLNVIAIKVTGDVEQSEDLAVWLGEGISAGAFVWASAWSYPDSTASNVRPQGAMAVVPGSWIVKDENNFLYAYPDERFNNTFQKGHI